MIIKAKKEDAGLVAAFAAEMWHHPVEELKADFEDIINSDKNAVFLFSLDGKEIGFAHCSLRYDYVEGTDSSPVGYLEGVLVSEPYRCHGIARELVEACERWSVSMGCSEFASDCELDNTASLAFHLKLGFVEANRNIHFTKKL